MSICLALVLGITLVLGASPVYAESRLFLGALGGVSTLSADGRTIFEAHRIANSSYDPANGPTAEVIVGAHFTNFATAQLEYSWNRNPLRVSALEVSRLPSDRAGTFAFYDQQRSSSQHSVIASFLLYFRDRASWARPYLAFGAGVTTLASELDRSVMDGPAAAIPARFSSTDLALDAAVGIDLRLRGAWAFRYSFAEMMRSNAISQQLSPPGERQLANFRNLFGFVKQF